MFIESPENEDEFCQIGAALGDMPLLANIVEGGLVLVRAKLVEMGFNFIIYPVAAMAASAALNVAYHHLRDGEPSGQRVGFQELSRMVGFRKIISSACLWRKAAYCAPHLGAA